jgi:4-hydroxy-2-oxoheptanedioate aldolase
MDLPRNGFKRALAEGRQQIGLWNAIPGSLVTEALAGAGFDWILLDAEHAPNEVVDLMPVLQALAAYPVSPVVRPAANDPVLIKRILDLGAQTLLVPYVQSAAEAAAAVAAVRYPPAGVRGVAGLTRASRFGRVKGYTARASEEISLLVQVETRAGMEAIEAIAAVDGIDGLFVGPSDLAASLGHPGDIRHPDMVAAVEQAITRIVAAGKPAGVLYLDPADARRCMALGTTFTAVGVDLGVLLRGAEALAADFRRPG